MVYREPYRQSLKEAERKGEEALLWDSYGTDNYCKMAIDTAVKRGRGDRELTMAHLGRVMREYGMERMSRLVANTISQRGKEGGFSGESVAWAKTIPVPECLFHGCDLWKEQVLSCDPGMVDMVADILRKEQICRNGQKTEAEKKPSIRMQLAMAPVSTAAVNGPAKKYDREVR